jgi:tRNA pseudouridine55 synthase
MVNKTRMLFLYKKPGQTPLQALNEYKSAHPEMKNTTLSYAGRLDPMADGLLLILEGEENKQRHQFEHLDKHYSFDILHGFSTDTLDIMGFVTEQQTTAPSDISADLAKELRTLIGTHTVAYPAYSSKYVQGHPLYWYARRQILHTIPIPNQTITIMDARLQKTAQISSSALSEYIQKRIRPVQGDFRQQEILLQWNSILSEQTREYPVYSCMIQCSSGTYIRSIVRELSLRLNVPLVTHSITRTKIGTWTLEDVK